jgi:hypothetical protein
MHLSLLVIAASFLPIGSRRVAPPEVELNWVAEDPPPTEPVAATRPVSVQLEGAAGGRRRGPSRPETPASVAELMAGAGPSGRVRPSGSGVGSLANALGDRFGASGLGDEVMLSASGEDGLGGEGGGDGNGVGAGKGSGFFGVRPAGTSIVYVLDCSRSMNHPDKTDAKTRFRRLKKELIQSIGAMPAESQSIGAMPAESQFFIVFFNETAIPMPSGSLVYATDSQKQRNLTWLAQMKPDGETDPRPALSMALRMKPDVICFLTDGSFDRAIEKDILRVSQKDTVIHTFAFGNETKVEGLKQFAEKNGGKFHFIP